MKQERSLRGTLAWALALALVLLASAPPAGAAGATYILPKASVTVLRGAIL